MVAEVGELLGTVGQTCPYLVADIVPVGAIAVVPCHGLDVEGGGSVQLLTDLAVVLQGGVHGVLVADLVSEAVEIVHDVVQKPVTVLGQLVVEGADVVGVGTAVVDVGHGVGHDLLDGGHGLGVDPGGGGLVLNVEARHTGEVGVLLDEVVDLLFGLGGPGSVGEVYLTHSHVHASLVGKLNGLQVVLIGNGVGIEGKIQLDVGHAGLLEHVEVVGIDLLCPEVGYEGDDVELILHAEGIHQHRGGVVHSVGHITGGDHGLAHGDGVHRTVGIHLDHVLVTAGIPHRRGIQTAVNRQLQPIRLPGVHAEGGLVDGGGAHLPRLVAVQLDLAQRRGGRAVGILDRAVAGDVQTEVVDLLGRAQRVLLGLHRQVVGGGRRHIGLGGVYVEPGFAVGRAQQAVVAGEALAVAPLHGVDDDLLQGVGAVQLDGDIHRVVLLDAAVGIGVPAQLYVAVGIGQPLAVVEKGGGEKALGGDIAVGGLNVLPLGEVVGGTALRYGGEGGEGEHHACQTQA